MSHSPDQPRDRRPKAPGQRPAPPPEVPSRDKPPASSARQGKRRSSQLGLIIGANAVVLCVAIVGAWIFLKQSDEKAANKKASSPSVAAKSSPTPEAPPPAQPAETSPVKTAAATPTVPPVAVNPSPSPGVAANVAATAGNPPAASLLEVRQGLAAIVMQDLANQRQFRLGTGWVAASRTIVTSAAVGAAIEELRQLGLYPQVFLASPSRSTRVTTVRVHPQYRAENPAQYDVAVLEVSSTLQNYVLPIDPAPAPVPQNGSFTMLGFPFRLDDYRQSISPMLPTPTELRVESQTTSPAEANAAMAVRFPVDLSDSNWSGSPVLNASMQVVGIYSRAAPVAAETGNSADVAHTITRIGRLQDFATDVIGRNSVAAATQSNTPPTPTVSTTSSSTSRQTTAQNPLLRPAAALAQQRAGMLKVTIKSAASTSTTITTVTDPQRKPLVDFSVYSLELNQAGVADLEQICAAPMRQLILRGNAFTDAHLGAVAKGGQIVDLTLESTACTDTGLQQLAQARMLQFLTLNGLSCSAAGLSALRQLPLSRLTLGPGVARDDNLAGLAGNTLLRSIVVQSSKLDGPGFTAMRGTMMDSVRLENCTLSATSCRALAEAMPRISMLTLRESTVTDDCLAALGGCRQLQYLYLDKTQITDAGLKHLSSLTSLRNLYLSGTLISDAGMAHLVRIPQLNSLVLPVDRCSAAAVDEFRKARPSCNVRLQ